MKADMWPMEPWTTMSIPFIDIAATADEALPLMTKSPPRPVAPAYWLALPSMMTVPLIMFSATPGPAEPLMRIVACLFIPAQ